MKFETHKNLGKDALKAWARIDALCQSAQRVAWRKPILLVGQPTSREVLRRAYGDPAEYGWTKLYNHGQVGDRLRDIPPDFVAHLDGFEPEPALEALIAEFGPPVCVSYGAHVGDWMEGSVGLSLFLGFTADRPADLLPAFAEWNVEVLPDSRQPRAELHFGFGADFGERGFVSGRSVRISRVGNGAELRIRGGQDLPWLYDHCAATLGKLNAKDSRWVGTGDKIPSFKAPKSGLPAPKVLPKQTLSRLIWNGKRSITPEEAPQLLSGLGQSLFGTPSIEVCLQAYEPVPERMVAPLKARSWQTAVNGERTVPVVPIADPDAFCTAHGHTPEAHTQAIWEALGPPTGIAWHALGVSWREQPVLALWSWTLPPDPDGPDTRRFLVGADAHAGHAYDRTRLRVRLQGHVASCPVPSRVQATVRPANTMLQCNLAFPSPSLDGALLTTLRAVHQASGVWLSGASRNWEVDWRDPLGFWNSEKSPHADRVGGKKKPTTYFEVDFHNYRVAEPKQAVRSGPVSDLESS